MFELFVSKLKSDGGYYFIASVTSQLFLFISTILIMKSLSIKEFGLYSIFLEYVTLAIILLESGTRTYYIKTDKSKHGLFNLRTIIFQFKIVLTMVPVFVVIGWFLFPTSDYSEMKILYFGIVIAIIGCLFVPYHSYLILNAKKKLILFRELLISSSRLIFCIVVIYVVCDFNYLYLSFIFIPVISVGMILVSKNTNEINNQLKLSVVYPFIFTASCSFLYNKIDIFMLAKISGEENVAIYAAGYKFIYPMMFISMVMNQILLPVIIKQSVNFSNLFKCFKLYVGIGVVISIASYLLFYFCNIYLFENKYNESRLIVIILTLYLPLVFGYGVFSNYLMTHNGEKTVLKISIVLTLINIILNFFLIPYYGPVGAAVSTIICECIICATYLILVKKRLRFV